MTVTRHRQASAGAGAVTATLIDGPLDGRAASVILERARQLVDPVLGAAIDALPGSMRRIALHHFGWEHADGTPSAGNAGTAIRPALVLAAAAATVALGGPEARTGAVRAGCGTGGGGRGTGPQRRPVAR